MRTIRLRTKFLLSLLAISAGLTAATLLIVRYSVQTRVRESLRDDLRNSVNTFESFEKQRDDALTRSAALIASLPNVQALMTTQDPATIQDASGGIWQMSGSDLLLFADRTGRVTALRTGNSALSMDSAQNLLRRSLGQGEARDWWFDGGHLYQVMLQPIHFGEAPQSPTIGLLVLGHEFNARMASALGNLASSEVAFRYGDSIVASTLQGEQPAELARQARSQTANSIEAPREIQLGAEHYLETTVNLSTAGEPAVSLSVLKSFDKATSFLRELNRTLLVLGLISVLAGAALVFFISDTFTRPLATLVAGVRALEHGDYSYPMERSGGDEVAEVTGAFTRMRATLQTSQQEHKGLEERLRQAHKMEAVGRLAGGVAHDFNNLLTIIRGHSDLLIDRKETDDFARRSVEQIQKAAGRAVAMTRQLLAFSRMQVLQPRVVDLNAIVAEMGKMLPRLIGEHIEYSFQAAAKLAPVKADPGQIEQVVMNLAVNARDAMPRGGKLVARTQNIAINEAEAAKRRPMSPGNYALLSVTDTGCGMDAETKAHIFEPFFTTKEVGKGTGLGLATVYGIVKQSSGFIWVESAPGKGTTFEIYLPQAAEKLSDAAKEQKVSSLPRGSETILVVEDEAGVRELACEFLKGSGYTVIEAKDGVEAIELAARHPGKIHLLVSDMVMPRMGGAELAERLRAARPEIKLLLMSGYSEYTTGQKVHESLHAMTVQKPFSLASLVEKVREALVDRGTPQPVETKVLD